MWFILLFSKSLVRQDQGWVSHQTQLCDSQVYRRILRCDSRTIMKSFLKEIARDFSGKFVRFLCKFPVNSGKIFLRNNFIIVRLSHLRNPAKNLRIAELRLMRNPSQIYINRKLWPIDVRVREYDIARPNKIRNGPNKHEYRSQNG